MGNYENILYETDDDQIATITLNRPDQMNAISPDLERELHEALDEADADDSVRVIIITGNGRAFSAGYDLGREREGIDTRSEALKQWMPTDMNHTDHVMHLMELDKPIIAAVNGWALGGGFWYTLACDITIAS
ncbi:MAG: enoyl-CoA hydratase/isomerase family protein, partial [Chloroflexi bacterium]|nr:enoyl-CoA hydratase/isomerase family protein [Chloroflexota bacterium]